MDPATTTVASLMTDVGTVFSQAISWVGEVASTIAENPILLIFCLLPLVGIGVGFFKRLISTH